ncbi:MAG: formylglycine-generating enzyme family protein [Polyangiaceae bacterium]
MRVLLAGALAGGCGAALPEPPPPHVRPTRRIPPAPVQAAAQGGTTDGFVALAPPGNERVGIRAGSFTMGSTSPEVIDAIRTCSGEPLGDMEFCEEKLEFANELSAHEVYLSAFWIDRTEVTVAQYRTCSGAGVCPELPYASGGTRFDVPDFPAVMVSWPDARRFCAWVGGGLPTEAQWERAARGARGNRYPWGNVYNPFLANHGRLAWDDLDDSDGYLEMAPVGSFLDGATADGIVDLAGNVEEWVADFYAPSYEEASVMDPKGPSSGDERVLRGGSYAHQRAGLRSSARGHALPDERRSYRGFRCAYDSG